MARQDQRSPRAAAVVVKSLAALSVLNVAHAHEDTGLSLETVTVTANGISNMTAASAGDVSQEQMCQSASVATRRRCWRTFPV